MNNWKYKLQAFMAGRYGSDEFNKFLFYLYLALLVLNVFIRGLLIHLLLWFTVIYSLYRTLSKNIPARQKENAKYLILKNKFTKKFNASKERFSDKSHVYKKCPHCKATLRFPRKKGKHSAVCPKCKGEMSVNVLFEYKGV